MTAELIDDKPLNPWVPERDPTTIAVLGKLMEETGELVAAASRCLIQGAGEAEPITGKPNLDWLEEEIADTLANLEMVTTHFGLDRDAIDARMSMKLGRLVRWHAMMDLALAPSLKAGES
jgi:NTP pyrophosphatase (non-canonical NTP hydrolase)